MKISHKIITKKFFSSITQSNLNTNKITRKDLISYEIQELLNSKLCFLIVNPYEYKFINFFDKKYEKKELRKYAFNFLFTAKIFLKFEFKYPLSIISVKTIKNFSNLDALEPNLYSIIILNNLIINLIQINFFSFTFSFLTSYYKTYYFFRGFFFKIVVFIQYNNCALFF